MSEFAGEQPPQGHASVFDFLYQDLPRISAFLAQLDDGLIQSLKRTAGTGSSSKDETQTGGKIGSSGTGVNLTGIEGTTTEQREGLERTFDPLWSNAIRLLDLLDQGGWVQRDIETAGIGRCVVVTGSLVIMDLGMLREMWKRPSIQKLLRAGVEQASQFGAANDQHAPRHERRREASLARSKNSRPSEAEVGLDIMDLLPHVTQGYLLQPGSETFFTLQVSGLAVPSGDLMLKHGLHLGAGWNMLGIVDALPSATTDDEVFDLFRVGASSHMAQMLTGMAHPLRELMGRPPTAYSVTPLLIFRPVSRGASV